MKRGILGLCLLGLLAAGGLVLGRATEHCLAPPEQKLHQAARAGDDWEKITALTRQARAEWEEAEGFGGVIFPQSAVEEIDGLFERLELDLRLRESLALASDCLSLAQRIRALADSQSGKLLHLL